MKSYQLFFLILLACAMYAGMKCAHAQDVVLTNTEIQLLQADEQSKSADIAIQESAIASDNADMNARIAIVNKEYTVIDYEGSVIDEWNNAQNNPQLNGI